MIMTGEKPNYWNEDLAQCDFFRHKSHTGWPGIEPKSPR
jgi:hypothetical protein